MKNKIAEPLRIATFFLIVVSCALYPLRMLLARDNTGAEKRSRSFTVTTRLKEKPFASCLFAYFEGSGTAQLQEQLRFAASADGIH